MKFFKLFEEYERKEINITELAKFITEYYNFDKCEYLGGGGEGIAFLVSDNKVLKITNNKQEALLAQELSKYNFKYLPNFFDVFMINTKHKLITSQLRFPYFDEIYFILQERLYDVDNATIIMKKIIDVLGEKYNPNNFIKNISRLESYFLKNNTSDELFGYYQELKNIEKELSDTGFTSNDSHAWNFAFKNNKLTLFDMFDKKIKGNINKKIIIE